MIEGGNNTQSAGKWAIRPSPVKSHVSNILAKLGVASRTEAFTLALPKNIVP
jgi:DNA-binding NarL/FixJ family response regulator